MKITFIAQKDNSINFFKELADKLSNKISNLSLEERFAPFVEDIPFIAFESTKESDLVFVFATSDVKDEVKLLKEKLIDVEIQTKTRILKAIESDSYSSSDEGQYIEDKLNLAEKYATLIVSILFNENEFEPKEKDFSI